MDVFSRLRRGGAAAAAAGFLAVAGLAGATALAAVPAAGATPGAAPRSDGYWKQFDTRFFKSNEVMTSLDFSGTNGSISWSLRGSVAGNPGVWEYTESAPWSPGCATGYTATKSGSWTQPPPATALPSASFPVTISSSVSTTCGNPPTVYLAFSFRRYDCLPSFCESLGYPYDRIYLSAPGTTSGTLAFPGAANAGDRIHLMIHDQGTPGSSFSVQYGYEWVAGTTVTPTTQTPTTQSPTTQSPTSQSPTTQTPTTQSPTSQSPTSQPPITPPPTPEPDDVAPVVTASKSVARRGGTAKLPYQIVEDSGQTQETVVLINKAGRTVRTLTTDMSETVSGETYHVKMKLKWSYRGGRFCVTSTDPSGNVSAPGCAAVKVR